MGAYKPKDKCERFCNCTGFGDCSLRLAADENPPSAPRASVGRRHCWRLRSQCVGGRSVRARPGDRNSPVPVRPAPSPAATDIKVLPVQKNVYLLASSAGNATVQIGDDGVLPVDTGHRSDGAEAVRGDPTLTNKPIHTIINTHLHSDHTGGNQSP